MAENGSSDAEPVRGSVSTDGVSPDPTPTSTPKTATADISRRCPSCLERYPSDFVVCPKCAVKLEQLTPDEDPLVGAVLAGSYRVLKVLGEGGMGRVYEARHLRLHSRRFAVKVLHPEYTRDTEVLTRFQREAEAAAAISDPHVLEVIDVHRTDDGRPFIVSELLEGQDFHDYLEDRKKIDTSTAAAIGRQVAQGLRAAHAAGVVHRDLKPENLFVVSDKSPTGRPDVPLVKILDFGISKLQGADTVLTRTGVIIGTPNYMAPEQARGEKIDHRVDLYALGAILFRMVTGRRAFEGTDTAFVISCVLNSEPPRPRTLEPSIPEAFEVVIQRAMAREAGDRYQDADELDRALAPFDEGASRPSNLGVAIAPVAGTAIDTDGAERAHTAAGSGSVAATAAVIQPRTVDRQRDQNRIEAAGRDARWARPKIVVLTLVVTAWLHWLLVSAGAGMMRAVHNEAENAESELVLLGAFAAAVSLTPLILWIVHLFKTVWSNTLRSIERANDLERLLVGSLAGYGLAAMAVRSVFVVLRSSKSVGSGWWDLLYLSVALVGGALGAGVGPLARLRRRLSNG